MADLPEADEFPAGITQIETTDPVAGGVDGVANRALIQLAKRTRFLYNRVTEAVFDAAGDYLNLRARGTTAEDVGLGSLQNFPLQHDPAAGVADEYASGAAAKTLYDMIGGVEALPADFAKNRIEVSYLSNDATLDRDVTYPKFSAVPITGNSNSSSELDGGTIGYVMVNGIRVNGTQAITIPAGWHLRIETFHTPDPG